LALLLVSCLIVDFPTTGSGTLPMRNLLKLSWLIPVIGLFIVPSFAFASVVWNLPGVGTQVLTSSPFTVITMPVAFNLDLSGNSPDSAWVIFPTRIDGAPLTNTDCRAFSMITSRGGSSSQYGAGYPSTDEYWQRIDGTMRQRFPDYFQASPQQAEKPVTRTEKPATVVAPASRSTSSKKIVLKQSELNLAKRLGLSPEQYAREKLLLNGGQ